MENAGKGYSISWYGSEFPKAINPSWPWWLDGWTFDGAGVSTPIIVGALIAKDAEEAKRLVSDARIGGRVKEWRFCEEQPAGWTPFTERYPRQPWMKWPEVAPVS